MKDESNELPMGWKCVTLSDVATIIRGIAFPKTARRLSSTADHVACLRTSNVQREVEWSDLWYVPRPYVRREEQFVRVGDILISTANSRELVGKVCILRSLMTAASLGAFISLIRANQCCVEKLLYYQMDSTFRRSQLREMASTTTNISNITVKNLSALEIALPPLAEQRRIVAKIEELFSELDAGVAALERVKANLKRYRAAVLKAAVEGKLTAEWRKKNPPTETGQQLLKRILAERQMKWEEEQLRKFAEKGKTPAAGWKNKYQQPEPPDTAGLAELPTGWCWANVGTLTEVNPAKDVANFPPDTPVHFLPMRDVAEEFGGADMSRMRPLREVARGYTQFRSGDIIFAKITPCMENGKLAIIPDFKPPLGYGSTEFHVLRTPQAFLGRWIARILSQESVRKEARNNFRGTAGQLRVPESWVAAVPVAIPPAAELAYMLSDIERRLSVADAVAAEVERSLKRAATLRQAILKLAFEGKLVAQNPADEPAAALLERMKAERAAVFTRPVKAVAKPLRRIAAPAARKTSPAGMSLKQAAIAAYAVNKLHHNRTFGRVQLEKILYLGQAHIGLDLGLQFERHAAGPLDKSLYKLESLAKKKNWFTTSTAPTEFGVRYHPGVKIKDRLDWAGKILGQRIHAFDALLGHISRMNTDQAELFATIHAAWSDRLSNGQPCGDGDIIKEVHGWHESKNRFTPAVIRERIKWMLENGYEPRGA